MINKSIKNFITVAKSICQKYPGDYYVPIVDPNGIPILVQAETAFKILRKRGKNDQN